MIHSWYAVIDKAGTMVKVVSLEDHNREVETIKLTARQQAERLINSTIEQQGSITEFSLQRQHDRLTSQYANALQHVKSLGIENDRMRSENDRMRSELEKLRGLMRVRTKATKVRRVKRKRK